MVLCAFLVYKGKNFPETENDPLQGVDKPLPYLFYRGIELHPRIFDVDVKQVNIFSFQNFLITIQHIYVRIMSFRQGVEWQI